MTSIGIDENVEAALAYVFGLLSGVLILIFESESRFARFHATQSILMFLGFVLARVLLNVSLFPFTLLGMKAVVDLFNWLISLAFVIAWIVCIVKALEGSWFKLPIIGDIAEKTL